ncbi:MAG: hypothetical protein II670_00540 [Alphaproteobacteria bacterium]|nr:hypothetical protein [Alphaproteobacteria bacterium]
MATIDTKEINERIAIHYSSTSALRKDMVSAITKMLKEMGGEISLIDKQYDDKLCIAYDGGNHVEYASSMFEEVASIKTLQDEEEFYVEVAGEDYIESHRLIFDDVCNIWDVVSSRYNDFNENVGKYKEVIEIANKNELKIQMNFSLNDELDIVRQFGEPIDLETLENPTCVEVKSYLYVDVLGLKEIDDLRNSDSEFCLYQNIVANLMKAKKPQYLIGAKDGIVQGLLWCEF